MPSPPVIAHGRGRSSRQYTSVAADGFDVGDGGLIYFRQVPRFFCAFWPQLALPYGQDFMRCCRLPCDIARTPGRITPDAGATSLARHGTATTTSVSNHWERRVPTGGHVVVAVVSGDRIRQIRRQWTEVPPRSYRRRRFIDRR